MSKFDEILNSSDASDALLGEQIDKLAERISALEAIVGGRSAVSLNSLEDLPDDEDEAEK